MQRPGAKAGGLDGGRGGGGWGWGLASRGLGPLTAMLQLFRQQEAYQRIQLVQRGVLAARGGVLRRRWGPRKGAGASVWGAAVWARPSLCMTGFWFARGS